MSKHLIALTIDTDPDGLNAHQPDRQTLSWEGLQFAIDTFHQALPDWKLTWYVRADGQLEHAYGTARYLLDTHADFWQAAIQRGDELGWHPHLYTVPATPDEAPSIITERVAAIDALTHTWEGIKDTQFDLASFRMGEAWHTPETLNLVESFGFTIDSTCIPGRDDSAKGHPRNWRGAPNHPYYPAHDMPRTTGQARSLLEIPMNSWYFQASYDDAPKLRYMNPCIHAELWQQALDRLVASWDKSSDTLHIWTLILHPNEAMPHDETDLLYSYSLETMRDNLQHLIDTIQAQGDEAHSVTISQAAHAWRTQHPTTS